MATMYWIGGSGTWDQNTAGHWSNTSGGASNGTWPGTTTDVVINGSSGSPTITLMDSGSGFPVCLSLTTTGASVVFTGGSSLVSAGNITLTASTSFTTNSGIDMGGTSNLQPGGCTIGQLRPTVGSVITLLGNLSVLWSFDVFGSFNANNYNVSAGSFYLATGSISMGSGLWTLAKAGTCWSYSAGTINPGTSTVRVTEGSAAAKYFALTGNTLNNFWNSAGGTVEFDSGGTFNDLKADAGTTTWFTAGTTITVTSITASGVAGNLTHLEGKTAATWTISKASGIVSLDYMYIKDSTASGGATFYAGSHSTDAGGNTGWIFTDAPIAPTVTTQAASAVLIGGMTGNGNITSNGGAAVTRRGFCYKAGTSGDPTTADSVAYDDGSFSPGAYTKALSGLTKNTSYRVRAYAINSAGTGYGTTLQEKTSTDTLGTFIFLI